MSNKNFDFNASIVNLANQEGLQPEALLAFANGEGRDLSRINGGNFAPYSRALLVRFQKAQEEAKVNQEKEDGALSVILASCLELPVGETVGEKALAYVRKEVGETWTKASVMEALKKKEAELHAAQKEQEELLWDLHRKALKAHVAEIKVDAKDGLIDWRHLSKALGRMIGDRVVSEDYAAELDLAANVDIDAFNNLIDAMNVLLKGQKISEGEGKEIIMAVRKGTDLAVAVGRVLEKCKNKEEVTEEEAVIVEGLGAKIDAQREQEKNLQLDKELAPKWFDALTDEEWKAMKHARFAAIQETEEELVTRMRAQEYAFGTSVKMAKIIFNLEVTGVESWKQLMPYYTDENFDAQMVSIDEGLTKWDALETTKKAAKKAQKEQDVKTDIETQVETAINEGSTLTAEEKAEVMESEHDENNRLQVELFEKEQAAEKAEAREKLARMLRAALGQGYITKEEMAGTLKMADEKAVAEEVVEVMKKAVDRLNELANERKALKATKTDEETSMEEQMRCIPRDQKKNFWHAVWTALPEGSAKEQAKRVRSGVKRNGSLGVKPTAATMVEIQKLGADWVTSTIKNLGVKTTPVKKEAPVAKPIETETVTTPVMEEKKMKTAIEKAMEKTEMKEEAPTVEVAIKEEAGSTARLNQMLAEKVETLEELRELAKEAGHGRIEAKASAALLAAELKIAKEALNEEGTVGEPTVECKAGPTVEAGEPCPVEPKTDEPEMGRIEKVRLWWKEADFLAMAKDYKERAMKKAMCHRERVATTMKQDRKTYEVAVMGFEQARIAVHADKHVLLLGLLVRKGKAGKLALKYNEGDLALNITDEEKAALAKTLLGMTKDDANGASHALPGISLSKVNREEIAAKWVEKAIAGWEKLDIGKKAYILCQMEGRTSVSVGMFKPVRTVYNALRGGAVWTWDHSGGWVLSKVDTIRLKRIVKGQTSLAKKMIETSDKGELEKIWRELVKVGCSAKLLAKGMTEEESDALLTDEDAEAINNAVLHLEEILGEDRVEVIGDEVTAAMADRIPAYRLDKHLVRGAKWSYKQTIGRVIGWVKKDEAVVAESNEVKADEVAKEDSVSWYRLDKKVVAWNDNRKAKKAEKVAAKEAAKVEKVEAPKAAWYRIDRHVVRAARAVWGGAVKAKNAVVKAWGWVTGLFGKKEEVSTANPFTPAAEAVVTEATEATPATN
jgi:hypothetical protein